MKYVFYESFLYDHNTARMRSVTTLTNKVTVYTDPQASLILIMQKKFGSKYASLNKNSNKLYVRERVRRASVKYSNKELYRKPEFNYSFVENTAINVEIEKGEMSWKK